MKSIVMSFLMTMMMHILSVHCRPLAPPAAAIFTEIPPQQLTVALDQGGSVVENRIGSRPPRCEHKCYGCSPCEATQMPTTTTSGQLNVSIQYSNYEPEGWKCKCGPTFYSP